MSDEESPPAGQRATATPSRTNRRTGRASPLAGWLFVFPGLVLAWALVAWSHERDARLVSEDRQLELVAQLREAESRAQGLVPAPVAEEREGSEARILQLEGQLLRAHQNSRRLQDLVAEFARTKDEASVPAAPAGFDPDESRRHTERLRRLNRALREHGLGTYRFLEFEALRDRVLLNADLLQTDLDGIVRGDFHADELRLLLDRQSGILSIRMKNAVRIWRGKRHALGEEHVLELMPTDPHGLAIAAAPFLSFENEWPVPEVDTGDRGVALRLEWKARFDRLLRKARAEGRYELFELDSVHGFEFRTVTLLGYTEKGLLERRIRAERLRVHVDEASGRTELRFFAGFVEGHEGRFEFPAQWYRLPLPGIPASEARELMTGAVHAFD